MTDRHVVVLAGGLTHEREVSLRSGSRLTEALRRQGLEVTVRDADSALLPWLAESKPDAAIIALHGGRGENGAVQGILELAGVPYLGTRSHDCRLSWDKPTAKTLVKRAGFHTPNWITLAHNTFRDLGASALIEALIGHLGLPLMLKPHQGGSALGATVVRQSSEVPGALVQAFAYGDVVLVEQFVEGVELAITVIDGAGGPRALPAVEIVPESGVFDYESRYTAGLTTYYTPARLTFEVAAAAADLAIGAHQALGLQDISRTDAIVDTDGRVQFLEVNVSPGLTETSMLPMSVEAAGEDLGAVYSQLIEQAITRADGPAADPSDG
ncbi:D-alanine--D-alanine ligase [Nakamurella sp. PAMC28650]|uniref:D-alanine--D-alanine ligase family protein n=1 Tax=Nakamurella sp. PAMC28650 TaxID=2762325 RepID=UPI00164E335B|nr:D-alanine--D-alanine ligase [Nakamurella sp. PAMC28650]QNK81904.1 D-alanine--D-alanine ligase [Nakamurella sp. PAMC28650]